MTWGVPTRLLRWRHGARTRRRVQQDNRYRHASIPDGVAAFRELGREHGFTVEATEDPAALTAALPGSAAVVFLSTSGEVLDAAARAVLRAYVEGGGGFMGVH